MQLKNGATSYSPNLGNGKYCGDEPPIEVLNTTSNALYVKYKGQLQKEFIISYQEKSLSCGGTISLDKFENQTFITSPNYPNIPQPYTECFWTITAPAGKRMRIDFLERFDLTPSQG